MQASENESKGGQVQLELRVQAEQEATQSWLDGCVGCRGAQYCGCCFQPEEVNENSRIVGL